MVVSQISNSYCSNIKTNLSISRFGSSSNMNAQELCENDDLATSLILDPFLGFTTHKMNVRLDLGKTVKGKTGFILDILDEYLCTLNFESCFAKILQSEWAQIYFKNKSQRQHQVGLLRYMPKLLI